MSGPSTEPLHTVSLGDSGPPVVFCHGLFGQGRNWTQIGKELADDHRVLLVDLPNHGQSPWTESVDLVDDADRLAELIRPLGPVALVGHSMGGKVAMLTALRHPDLVERLAIVDISPVTYDSKDEFAGYIDAMTALDLDAIERRSDADARLRQAVPIPMVRSFLLQNLRRSDEGWRWQLNLPVLRAALDDIGGWHEEWTQDSEPYDGPTWWIAGANSAYVQDEYAPAMEALFPRVRRVTVKEAGHWVHSERPDVFVQVLEQFLSSGRRPR
ncbi:alpha/beta fold hydrolase [Nocardioides gilvus]|uniref:alpha/beta fold hydrolase n=1 Tax=Nocardioides gilvus TaxID=1735589 RepID=UPI000D74F6E0|nr:alpha/beta fold hydrolase [Nocardioides gilvus]